MYDRKTIDTPAFLCYHIGSAPFNAASRPVDGALCLWQRRVDGAF